MCCSVFGLCRIFFLKVLGAMHLAAWEYGKLALLNALSKTKRQLIGSHVEALLVNSKNGLFLVDVEDQTVGRRLWYDKESMGWRS